ncbi:MAG: hypothetical protein JNJ54_24235 [Myxococcaceae bacterium]|nr:hypothetical protein [Myxococcaceae bacterium]
MEQELTRQSDGEGGLQSPDEAAGLGRVRSLLIELERTPADPVIALAFNRAVSALAKQPSAEVFGFLRELNELPVLRQAKDSNGYPCRAAVLAAWVELGYPWALELAPEDHAWLRAQTPGAGAGWLSVTFVLAVLSAIFNVGVSGLLAFEFLSRPSWVEWLVVVPFAAMGAHGIATLAAAQAGLDGGPAAAGRLRALGYAGLVAPAAALVPAVISLELGLCVLLLGLPFTASALTAWWASRALSQGR